VPPALCLTSDVGSFGSGQDLVVDGLISDGRWWQLLKIRAAGRVESASW
jgi:hypothetical protein